MTRRGICRASVVAIHLIVTGLVVVSAPGCRCLQRRQKVDLPLLDARQIIPPPFSQPGIAGGAVATTPMALPPEPMPAGVDLPVMLPPQLEVMEMPEPTPLAETVPAPPEGGLELPAPVVAEALTYQVKKGDSLWKIGRMYGVTHQELAACNDLKLDATLKVGTVLQIPPGGAFVPAEDRPPIRHQPETVRTVIREPIPAGREYKVKSGDSLWLIARKFGVKLDDLRKANDLTTDTLQVDQKLRIPGPGQVDAGQPERPPAPPPVDTDHGVETDETPRDDGEVGAGEDVPRPPDPAVAPRLPNLLNHTVTEEDTLGSIAEMYGTTVDAIKEANPAIGSDEDLILNAKILVPFE